MASTTLAFQKNPRGGRLITAAAALFALIASSAAAQELPPNVTVTEESGVYRVVARFLVDQPSSIVWSVLTDYEGIPRFVPEIRTSRILDRSNSTTIVEQEAVSSVLLFSKRIHLVLEIDEQPDALIFHDR